MLHSILFWRTIIGEFCFQRGSQLLNSGIIGVSGPERGNSQGQLADAVFSALPDESDDLRDLFLAKPPVLWERITAVQQIAVQSRDPARCVGGEVGIVPLREGDDGQRLTAITCLLPHTHPVKADLTGGPGQDSMTAESSRSPSVRVKSVTR